MKQTLFFILLMFLVLFSQTSPAQVYKWVDEKGVTHFTDDMTQVPEKHRPMAEGVQAPQENEATRAEEELAPKKKEVSDTDQLGRGEDYWKGRLQEWRKKLSELQDRVNVLKMKYNSLTDRLNASQYMATRAELRRDRDQVKSEIDQCNSQIEEARSMLEKKIPEEAEIYKAKPEWVKQ
jgi:chromosome segregation ATPase